MDRTAQLLVRPHITMDQKALYSIIETTGFMVWEFQDHPRYFGSWRATIERRNVIYQIISDGRESWLELQLIQQDKDLYVIKGVAIHSFSDNDQLKELQVWLNELVSA